MIWWFHWEWSKAWTWKLVRSTAWKVPEFGVFLVRIFPHSVWILRIFPYSVQMPENTDQKNSEHGHFSRSLDLVAQWKLCQCIKNCSFRIRGSSLMNLSKSFAEIKGKKTNTLSSINIISPRRSRPSIDITQDYCQRCSKFVNVN